jgi:hypothetical protein
MTKDLQEHIFQYLLLATVAVFFIVLLSLAQGDKTAQFFIILLFTFFYILWGIIHHITDRTLHLKIVIEYILIGATAFFLFQLLLIK